VSGQGLKRFGGVNRWSPPGRLARKKVVKPPKTARAACPFCFQAHVGMRCLTALSSPEQRTAIFAKVRD